jgi:hypothetical protein
MKRRRSFPLIILVAEGKSAMSRGLLADELVVRWPTLGVFQIDRT